MSSDANEPARLLFREGAAPYSVRYRDIYFSADDPTGEARHVFMAGNGLPGRFRSGFHIAEIGFGTGMNMLVALREWVASGQQGRLRYTGFEAHPMASADIERALEPFAELADIAAPILRQLASGATGIRTGNLDAQLVVGDARRCVPAWTGCADAWFLDGFAPARNPQPWEDRLLGQVAERTASGGTIATFTAAGRVRRALAAAGFAVERRPGFGRKRHMLCGRLSQS